MTTTTTDCWTRLTRSLPVLARYVRPWIMTALPASDGAFAVTFERGHAQLRLLIAVDKAMQSSYDFYVDDEHRAEGQGSLMDTAYMNALLTLLDAHFVDRGTEAEERGG
jgi:hypothetical protein